MRTIRIGLAGLGTVGGGVVNLLRARAPELTARYDVRFDIVAVAVRDSHKKRAVEIVPDLFVANPVDLATRENVDVVVELMGGADGFALDLARSCLHAGKPLVTANKAMLAKHGLELFALSAQHNVPLKFEAAVGGGVPMVKLFAEGLAGARITEFHGILNGTCNYILTQMRDEGWSFDQALAAAQKLGYAEADPSADIDGHDTAHKAAILFYLVAGNFSASTCLSVRGIRQVSTDDIAQARAKGQVIKLLATYRDEVLSVGPEAIPENHPLARVDGVMNGLWYNTDSAGSGMIMGAGAGAGPTATAVLADLIDLARMPRFQ